MFARPSFVGRCKSNYIRITIIDANCSKCTLVVNLSVLCKLKFNNSLAISTVLVNANKVTKE